VVPRKKKNRTPDIFVCLTEKGNPFYLVIGRFFKNHINKCLFVRQFFGHEIASLRTAGIPV
jgi:hypothetical protein